MLRAWRVAQLHVAACGERDGEDSRFQDAAKHLLDRARTHESSAVQAVQAGSEQGRDSHSDACLCEARAQSHDFVSHASCATSDLVRAMVVVYGSVKRVPVARGGNTLADQE